MWRVREQMVAAITLKVDADLHTEETIRQLAALCGEHKGTKKLYVELTHPRMPQPVRLHARTAVVDLTPDLMKGLSQLVGREGITLEATS